ncbi:Late Golgi vesicles protein [Podila humilis]|nr:Late Golgi vesicles protein [Podila humilis]
MAQGASLFRLVNIVIGVFIVLGGILLFVNIKSWNSGILGIFVILLGILTFALEFIIPEAIVYNLGFMFSLLGRGLFYVSMGVLTLAWKWYNIVVGCVIMAAGLFFIAMHFVGATPCPSMSAVPNTSSANLNPGTGGDTYTNPSTTNYNTNDSNVDAGKGVQPDMTQTY